MPNDLAPLTSTLSKRPDWTRTDWTALADRMLAAVRPYASVGHARITLPGPEGGYGRAVDGLEGFARTFLLAGFRIAGERGEGLDELIDWYSQGLTTGTDPTSSERWVRLDEHPQAKVEAASIALILDLTRPWLWDRLSPSARARIVAYLSPAVGDDSYPRINWVWFRLVVQTFLRSVGGPHSVGDMGADLATHDSFTRADGWLSDGADRSYDHYVGWALHLYPTLWARMAGASDLAAPRRERDRAALDRFLADAVALVGADGSPLVQGRSLIYRFAAAAPFWVGALAGVPSVPTGQLRRAANRVMDHFVSHAVPDERGLLTLGWHAPWPRLAQSYSGPSSPYWAAKGMLGIALPADHPVWTADEQPLPSEAGGALRAVRAPGWVVVSTADDGIVRVVNHGTDHAVEGSLGADSPLYARLGYSTSTSPVLNDHGWDEPLDQAVVLVDRAGRSTHRSGMRTLDVRIDGAPPSGYGVAGSVADVHWVEADRRQPDHGGPRPGRSVPAGRITVYSVVRGHWELRLSRVDSVLPGQETAGSAAGTEAIRLRVGGWAVAGPCVSTVDQATATVIGAAVRSRVVALAGGAAAGIAEYEDASPLAAGVRVPWLVYPVRIGTWVTTLIELAGKDAAEGGHRPTVSIQATGPAQVLVQARWPDGLCTSTQINEGGVATPVAP